jgi:hypothetical protein
MLVVVSAGISPLRDHHMKLAYRNFSAADIRGVRTGNRPDIGFGLESGTAAIDIGTEVLTRSPTVEDQLA